MGKTDADRKEEEIQHRLHQSSAQAFGLIIGDDPNRSQNVRAYVRSKLRVRRTSRQTFVP